MILNMEKLLQSYKELKEQSDLINDRMKATKILIEAKLVEENLDDYANKHFLVFRTARKQYKWDNKNQDLLVEKGYLSKEVKYKQTKDDKKLKEAILLGEVTEEIKSSITIRKSK